MNTFYYIIILLAHLVHLQAQYFHSESDSLDSVRFKRQLFRNDYIHRTLICPNGVRCIEKVDVIDLSERFKPHYVVVPLTVENVTCSLCYDLYDNNRVYTKTVAKNTPYFIIKATQCNLTLHNILLGNGCDCSG